MGIHIRELNRSMQRHTSYWILMTMVLTLSLVISHIMWRDVRYVWLAHRDFKHDIADKTIFYTSFEMSSSEMHRWEDPDMLAILQEFRETLDDQIEGIRTYDVQSYSGKPISGFPDLPDPFIQGYFMEQLPKQMDLPGVPATDNPRPLNLLLVTENFIDEFGMKVTEGQRWRAGSYHYDFREPVDVILGSAFKDYFRIGDRMVIQYMEEMTLEVIGFLEAGSMYPDQSGRVEIVDHSILCPSFTSFGQTGIVSRTSFMWGLLINSAAPKIIVEDPGIDVFEEVNAVSAQYDAFPLRVSPISYADTRMIESSSGQQVSLTAAMTLLVFAVIAVTLAILISSKIRINLKAYSLYMLTGGSPRQVFIMMMTEMVLLLGFAVSFAVLLLLQVDGLGYQTTYLRYLIRHCLLYATGLVLITAGITIFQLSKLNLAELIRRNRT